ncbi:hypothetical protein QTP88_022491 [Uroleucon formosanum]
MAFRGINDKLYEPHNGNFLRLIELIAKFDHVLKDHISRSAPTVEGVERKHTYLSHTIQDELITKMAEKLNLKLKTGFISSIITAKELANDLELDPKFEEKRVRRKKTQFSYEGSDDPIINAQDNFHVNYFLKIVDTAIISFQKRFTTYEEHANIFGFVYTLNKLKDMKQEELLKNCKDLHLKLEDDIDGIDLYEDLMMLRNILPQNYSILEALQFIFDNNLSEIYPNSIIVLQIILTSPVTTATAEWSFSKLKIIKNYLRSTISQERFTSLSILSIEHDIAKSMDYNDVVLEFAAKRARGLKY